MSTIINEGADERSGDAETRPTAVAADEKADDGRSEPLARFHVEIDDPNAQLGAGRREEVRTVGELRSTTADGLREEEAAIGVGASAAPVRAEESAGESRDFDDDVVVVVVAIVATAAAVAAEDEDEDEDDDDGNGEEPKLDGELSNDAEDCAALEAAAAVFNDSA